MLNKLVSICCEELSFIACVKLALDKVLSLISPAVLECIISKYERVDFWNVPEREPVVFVPYSVSMDQSSMDSSVVDEGQDRVGMFMCEGLYCQFVVDGHGVRGGDISDCVSSEIQGALSQICACFCSVFDQKVATLDSLGNFVFEVDLSITLYIIL
jgi:hypothetical protein